LLKNVAKLFRVSKPPALLLSVRKHLESFESFVIQEG
jgi:hypothetical protein